MKDLVSRAIGLRQERDRLTPMANSRRIQARPHGQGSGWLALLGYAALGLACLLLALVTFIFVAAPIDGMRDRLVQDIKARTGRDFVVSGPTSLKLVPRLAVSFADVSLSPAPGMRGEPILRAQALEAEVGFLSLFSPQPTVRRLVLSRPVIELRVDAQGRRSWDFAAARNGARAVGAGGPVAGAIRAGLRRAERSSRLPSTSSSQPACASSTAPCATSTSAPAYATRLARSSSILPPTPSDGATRGQGRFRLARREDGVRGGPVLGPGRAGGAEGPADLQAGRTADRGQLRRRHRGCSRAGTGRACQHQSAIAARSRKLARRPDGRWTAGPRPPQPIELARRRRRPGVAVAPDGDAWRHLARG